MLGYGRDESAPTPGGMFVGCLRNIRHVIGRPSAAVGADLSCPHIRKHPRNGKRKCACGDVDMCV